MKRVAEGFVASHPANSADGPFPAFAMRSAILSGPVTLAPAMPSYVRAVVILCHLSEPEFSSAKVPGGDGLIHCLHPMAHCSLDSLIHKSAHTHIHHDAQRQKNEQYRRPPVAHQRQGYARDRHETNYHANVD